VNQKTVNLYMSNSAMGIFEPFSAFWKLTTERVLFSLLLLRLSGGEWDATGKEVNILKEISWTRSPSVEGLTTAIGSLTPRFLSNDTVKVWAPKGGTAAIECHVANLGDRAVSWIRKRDLHILTIGSITYTADRRFQSSQSLDSTVWRLSIEPTLHTDAGMYECQISTEPKISKLFKLTITDSVAKIAGGRSVYMREGSLLNISCTIQGQVKAAQEILWFRDKHLLNSSGRGGISITTDKVSGRSRLEVWGSRLADSGEYSCKPDNALPDSVAIHVLTGGDLAAIQEPEGLTARAGRCCSQSVNSMVILTIITWLRLTST